MAKRKNKKNTMKASAPRNPLVLGCILRGGKGPHRDARKEALKKACRGKVEY